MDSAEAPQPAVIFKKRNAKGKSNFRKRAATPPASDSDSDYSSSEDESGRKIKRRKGNTGVITASSKDKAVSATEPTASRYAADRSTSIKSSNDATKQSNWYDESATDALSSRNLLGSTRTQPTSTPSDGTYKGLANATTFITKNPDAPNRSIGPIKAPTNIRTITVTDFAPDVCKDYKQTGFCGFGDNCKFLHAREDYKQGWQLDKEWEKVTKGKSVRGVNFASANRNEAEDSDNDEEAALEGIPFACIICRGKYRDPIVTKCGHYFCEACALKRYRKDPSCAACGAGTGGVFNVAKGLKKLLGRKREAAKKRREKAIEAGEEVSSEEDDED
ncbi:hypothetical protein BJ875DRAFT_453155 [Amylocarpus encephaloides]|uniref:Pre-mRNA-splicing factor CWC24 n=1 Tax=Amylocarpus encephaloides TaxID=45428 RepID=A0A9P7YQS4_9HELO|nr:hypothetical protein BJ875DRAFT_453155 [Amylocarpus encephaloides]